ncbi:MAG: TetR family transcriptional regulator [Myxococcota bacterium]
MGAEPRLRETILANAAALFADRGYSATSVREVAEACKCTKPALYYHFASKEALYLACLAHETEKLLSLERQLLCDATLKEQLTHGLGLFFDHVQNDPTGMRLLMRAELRPEPNQPAFDFEAMRAHHLGQIQELLAAGVARGELRRDLDLDDAAYALKGMVDQRMQMWLHGVALPADLPARIVSLYFYGAAVR